MSKTYKQFGNLFEGPAGKIFVNVLWVKKLFRSRF